MHFLLINDDLDASATVQSMLHACRKSDAIVSINSLLARSDLCSLLIVFANSLDSDQDGQNVGRDLDPNCLTL